jgi:hypothetical protein
VQAPLRIVRRLLGEDPALTIELSMRRSLGAALEALERGELDACFGRVHDLGHPWPSGLARRPVVLERLAVAVNAGHPLAGAAQLRPADLRESGLWLPASGSPAELLSAYRQIAGHFGIPLDTSGHNLGLEHAIDQLRRHPHRLILFGADWPLPPRHGRPAAPPASQAVLPVVAGLARTPPPPTAGAAAQTRCPRGAKRRLARL